MEEQTQTINIDKGADYFIYGASAICIGMIFFAGTSIAFAMLTAILGTASVMYLMFEARKSGRTGAKFWNWCLDNPIKCDIAMSVLFGVTFGVTTASGILAAGAAGCMNSAAFKLIRRFSPNDGYVDVPPKEPKTSRKSYDNSNRDIIPTTCRVA